MSKLNYNSLTTWQRWFGMPVWCHWRSEYSSSLQRGRMFVTSQDRLVVKCRGDLYEGETNRHHAQGRFRMSRHAKYNWIKTAPGVWLFEHHSVSRRFLGGVVETGKGYTGKASFAWHCTSGEQGESKTKAEAKREVEKYTKQKRATPMTNDLPARFADETPITEEWLDSMWPRDPDGARQWFLDGQMDGDGEWFLTGGARFWTIAHIGRCRLTLEYKPTTASLLKILAALGWSGKSDDNPPNIDTPTKT